MAVTLMIFVAIYSLIYILATHYLFDIGQGPVSFRAVVNKKKDTSSDIHVKHTNMTSWLRWSFLLALQVFYC